MTRKTLIPLCIMYTAHINSYLTSPTDCLEDAGKDYD